MCSSLTNWSCPRLAAVTNAIGFVVQYAYDVMDRLAASRRVATRSAQVHLTACMHTTTSTASPPTATLHTPTTPLATA